MPSTPPPPTAPNAPRTRSVSWPAAITIIVLATLFTGAFLAVYLIRQAKAGTEATLEAGRRGIVALREIAEAFRTGEVTTSFSSFTTQIEGSSRFQFATVDQLELFERSDSATAFWGQLELPRVVVEARAPVQYSYFLDLNGAWNFVLRDTVLLVRAPPIEFNRPSFNPSKIVYRVPEDSIWRDEEPVLEALRMGLGEMAAERAKENIKLVRELGRQRATDFVEQWLLANFGAQSEDVQVTLYFADEETPEGLDSTLPALSTFSGSTVEPLQAPPVEQE